MSSHRVHSQVERARVIFKYALDNVPKSRAEELYTLYASFEKRYGDREGLENVIFSKKRFQYEDVRSLAVPVIYD